MNGSADGAYKLDKVLQGHQRWVWDMAYSADSAYLVSGESFRQPRAKLLLWSYADVVVHPSASSDHTARLWELASGTTVRQVSCPIELEAVAFADEPLSQYSAHHKACVCVALNDSSS